MALHESQRTSFASTGRVLATLAGLILVPPFALLALVPMLLDLTDATGSSADLVKVKITRLSGAA